MIVRVANFLSYAIINGSDQGGVPVSNDDQFQYLDEPFAPKSAVDAMNNSWDQHSMEIGACKKWFWDEPLVSDADKWSDSGDPT